MELCCDGWWDGDGWWACRGALPRRHSRQTGLCGRGACRYSSSYAAVAAAACAAASFVAARGAQQAVAAGRPRSWGVYTYPRHACWHPMLLWHLCPRPRMANAGLMPRTRASAPIAALASVQLHHLANLGRWLVLWVPVSLHWPGRGSPVSHLLTHVWPAAAIWQLLANRRSLHGHERKGLAGRQRRTGSETQEGRRMGRCAAVQFGMLGPGAAAVAAGWQVRLGVQSLAAGADWSAGWVRSGCALCVRGVGRMCCGCLC